MDINWNPPLVNGQNGFFTEAAYNKYSFNADLLAYLKSKEEELAHESDGEEHTQQPTQQQTQQLTQQQKQQQAHQHIQGKQDVKQEGNKETYSQQIKGAKHEIEIVHNSYKSKLPYPKLSSLTKKEQRQYLELFQKYKKRNPYNEREINEVNFLKELQARVMPEQEDYMNYLRDVAYKFHADYDYMLDDAKDFVESWLNQLKVRVSTYPRYYVQLNSVCVVPPKFPKPVVFAFKKTVLSVGKPNNIIMPNANTIHNKVRMTPSRENMKNKYHPPQETTVKTGPSPEYEPKECSRDPYCEAKAIQHKAHIVISSGTLKCLLDNHPPHFNRQWELPVIVKVYKIKDPSGNETCHKVVYLDKRFIPKTMTTREKNQIYYKKACRVVNFNPAYKWAKQAKKHNYDAVDDQQADLFGKPDGSRSRIPHNSPVKPDNSRSKRSVKSESSSFGSSDDDMFGADITALEDTDTRGAVNRNFKPKRGGASGRSRGRKARGGYQDRKVVESPSDDMFGADITALEDTDTRAGINRKFKPKRGGASDRGRGRNTRGGYQDRKVMESPSDDMFSADITAFEQMDGLYDRGSEYANKHEYKNELEYVNQIYEYSDHCDSDNSCYNRAQNNEYEKQHNEFINHGKYSNQPNGCANKLEYINRVYEYSDQSDSDYLLQVDGAGDGKRKTRGKQSANGKANECNDKSNKQDDAQEIVESPTTPNRRRTRLSAGKPDFKSPETVSNAATENVVHSNRRKSSRQTPTAENENCESGNIENSGKRVTRGSIGTIVALDSKPSIEPCVFSGTKRTRERKGSIGALSTASESSETPRRQTRRSNVSIGADISDTQNSNNKTQRERRSSIGTISDGSEINETPKRRTRRSNISNTNDIATSLAGESSPQNKTPKGLNRRSLNRSSVDSEASSLLNEKEIKAEVTSNSDIPITTAKRSTRLNSDDSKAGSKVSKTRKGKHNEDHEIKVESPKELSVDDSVQPKTRATRSRGAKMKVDDTKQPKRVTRGAKLRSGDRIQSIEAMDVKSELDASVDMPMDKTTNIEDSDENGDLSDTIAVPNRKRTKKKVAKAVKTHPSTEDTENLSETSESEDEIVTPKKRKSATRMVLSDSEEETTEKSEDESEFSSSSDMPVLTPVSPIKSFRFRVKTLPNILPIKGKGAKKQTTSPKTTETGKRNKKNQNDSAKSKKNLKLVKEKNRKVAVRYKKLTEADISDSSDSSMDDLDPNIFDKELPSERSTPSVQSDVTTGSRCSSAVMKEEEDIEEEPQMSARERAVMVMQQEREKKAARKTKTLPPKLRKGRSKKPTSPQPTTSQASLDADAQDPADVKAESFEAATVPSENTTSQKKNIATCNVRAAREAPKPTSVHVQQQQPNITVQAPDNPLDNILSAQSQLLSRPTPHHRGPQVAQVPLIQPARRRTDDYAPKAPPIRPVFTPATYAADHRFPPSNIKTQRPSFEGGPRGVWTSGGTTSSEVIQADRTAKVEKLSARSNNVSSDVKAYTINVPMPTLEMETDQKEVNTEASAEIAEPDDIDDTPASPGEPDTPFSPSAQGYVTFESAPKSIPLEKDSPSKAVVFSHRDSDADEQANHKDGPLKSKRNTARRNLYKSKSDMLSPDGEGSSQPKAVHSFAGGIFLPGIKRLPVIKKSVSPTEENIKVSPTNVENNLTSDARVESPTLSAQTISIEQTDSKPKKNIHVVEASVHMSANIIDEPQAFDSRSISEEITTAKPTEIVDETLDTVKMEGSKESGSVDISELAAKDLLISDSDESPTRPPKVCDSPVTKVTESNTVENVSRQTTPERIAAARKESKTTTQRVLRPKIFSDSETDEDNALRIADESSMSDTSVKSKQNVGSNKIKDEIDSFVKGGEFCGAKNTLSEKAGVSETMNTSKSELLRGSLSSDDGRLEVATESESDDTPARKGYSSEALTRKTRHSSGYKTFVAPQSVCVHKSRKQRDSQSSEDSKLEIATESSLIKSPESNIEASKPSSSCQSVEQHELFDKQNNETAGNDLCDKLKTQTDVSNIQSIEADLCQDQVSEDSENESGLTICVPGETNAMQLKIPKHSESSKSARKLSSSGAPQVARASMRKTGEKASFESLLQRVKTRAAQSHSAKKTVKLIDIPIGEPKIKESRTISNVNSEVNVECALNATLSVPTENEDLNAESQKQEKNPVPDNCADVIDDQSDIPMDDNVSRGESSDSHNVPQSGENVFDNDKRNTKSIVPDTPKPEDNVNTEGSLQPSTSREVSHTKDNAKCSDENSSSNVMPTDDTVDGPQPHDKVDSSRDTDPPMTGLDYNADHVKSVRHCVSYDVWQLGNLKVLLRCRYHGQTTMRGQESIVHISPKLEYQPPYGFEQVSTSEACRNWTDVTLRPDCVLLRPRINVFSSDCMMFDKLDQRDVLPPMAQFNPTASTNVLYDVLYSVTQLKEGNYLLSHTPGNSHAHIKKTTESTRGVYDLHLAYKDAGRTVPTDANNVPWVPLDPSIVSYFHKRQNRVPATFEPKDSGYIIGGMKRPGQFGDKRGKKKNKKKK